MTPSNSRRAVVLATLVLLVTPHVHADDQVDQRFRVPNTIAQRIAGELFPNHCGPSGEGCGIKYPPANCPKLFAITFPDASRTTPPAPEMVWVTVDSLGKVVSVNAVRPSCHGGISS